MQHSYFYMPDAFSVTQSTVSRQWRNNSLNSNPDSSFLYPSNSFNSLSGLANTSTIRYSTNETNTTVLHCPTILCRKSAPPVTNTRTRLMALCRWLPGWAGTRKVKPIWILLNQKTVSGSGISWAICKSAHHSRQITTPAPHHSVFYRPEVLPGTQPCQLIKIFCWRSFADGNYRIQIKEKTLEFCSMLQHLGSLWQQLQREMVTLLPWCSSDDDFPAETAASASFDQYQWCLQQLIHSAK